MQIFIVDRIDVVDALQRRGRVFGMTQLLFERGQLLERIRDLRPPIFS